MYQNEFDKNRKRVSFCPCGKSNQDGKFAPFVGYTDAGHCFACPKTFFPDNTEKKQAIDKASFEQIDKSLRMTTSVIHKDFLQHTLTDYGRNTFASFLVKLLGNNQASRIIKSYLIGTSQQPWKCSTVFWQVDQHNNIRAGKIFSYNLTRSSSSSIGYDCKRNKENYLPVDWIHNRYKLRNFKLKQCLFGEHLLKKHPNLPVALVESEKSAIIASAYLPQFLWLATGGLHFLKKETCAVLKGRKIILYPDLGGYDSWKKRAFGLELPKVSVSDLLEKKANELERNDKLDIADFLLRFDHKAFLKNNY